MKRKVANGSKTRNAGTESREMLATKLRGLADALNEIAEDVECHTLRDRTLAETSELAEGVRALIRPGSWGPEPRARMAIIDVLDEQDAHAAAYLAFYGATELFAKLDPKDLAVAREIWAQNGVPRQTTRLPAKWPHVAKMFARAGITGKGGKPLKASSLKTEWLKWTARTERKR